MYQGRFVGYFRVSTQAQGASGLGLDAQRAAVSSYVDSVGGNLVASYEEVESASAKDRPELQRAIATAKSKKAMLVIAKLDRLARNVSFVSKLLESGVEFVAADMPHANKLTIHIISAVAEYEREVIAKRTKDALAAAKARGVKLGNPNAASQAPKASAIARHKADDFARRLSPLVRALHHEVDGSLAATARALNDRGVRTQRGKSWTATGVKNILERSRSLNT